MDYPELALHVAGRWITRASGGERPVIDPASATAPGPAAAGRCVTNCRPRPKSAAPRLSPVAHEDSRSSAARVLRARRRPDAPARDAIAAVLTLEQGKPLAEAGAR
jgi:succinate-semialdehyde dehydrogenase/glutarate-semialdehyde dehydrogenase